MSPGRSTTGDPVGMRRKTATPPVSPETPDKLWPERPGKDRRMARLASGAARAQDAVRRRLESRRSPSAGPLLSIPACRQAGSSAPSVAAARPVPPRARSEADMPLRRIGNRDLPNLQPRQHRCALRPVRRQGDQHRAARRQSHQGLTCAASARPPPVPAACRRRASATTIPRQGSGLLRRSGRMPLPEQSGLAGPRGPPRTITPASAPRRHRTAARSPARPAAVRPGSRFRPSARPSPGPPARSPARPISR